MYADCSEWIAGGGYGPFKGYSRTITKTRHSTECFPLSLDVVFLAPSEKHLHGPSSNIAMSHIAMQEVKDGKVVDWLERVADEQYGT